MSLGELKNGTEINEIYIKSLHNKELFIISKHLANKILTASHQEYLYPEVYLSK